MSETQPLRRAVFLDRDGTIGEEMGYVNHVDRFQIFPFAAEAIRHLNQADIPVIVVTNQSGNRAKYFSGIADPRSPQENDRRTRGRGRLDRRDLLLPAQVGRRVRMPQAESGLASTRRPESMRWI